MNITYKEINLHKKNVTSQFGEDGIIDYLIKILDDDLNMTCCEVGASDGITDSNTYVLWSSYNWNALLIEANNNRYAKLTENTYSNKNVTCINKFIQPSGENSILNIALKNNINLNNGLIVIDIDSIDSYIFSEIKQINPAICLVEYNNGIPPWIDYQDSQDQCFLRHSLAALERIGNDIGYSLITATCTNAIFMRTDICVKHNIQASEATEVYPFQEQFKNGYLWSTCVISQMLTTYPVFINKPTKFDRIYFKIRGFLKSIIKSDEKYVAPNSNNKKRIADSGLFL